MPGHTRLLVDVLDRHEAHVALARGGGNRLGIVGIVLGQRILAERPNELRRHQAWNQAVFQTKTRPMVRTAACLHRNDGAARQLNKPRSKRRALEI